MKRKALLQTIETEVTKVYNFSHSFVYKINEYRGAYPLWLQFPLQPISYDSVKKNTTYKVEAILFVKNEDFSEDEKEEQWENMEGVAKTVYKALDALARTSGDIVKVSGFTAEVDEFAVDTRGSVSLRVKFDVEVYECTS